MKEPKGLGGALLLAKPLESTRRTTAFRLPGRQFCDVIGRTGRCRRLMQHAESPDHRGQAPCPAPRERAGACDRRRNRPYKPRRVRGKGELAQGAPAVREFSSTLVAGWREKRVFGPGFARHGPDGAAIATPYCSASHLGTSDNRLDNRRGNASCRAIMGGQPYAGKGSELRGSRAKRRATRQRPIEKPPPVLVCASRPQHPAEIIAPPFPHRSLHTPRQGSAHEVT